MMHDSPEWLPWALTPLLVSLFIVIEAWLHSVLFDTGTTFMQELTAPAPHEIWMRLLVVGLLVLMAWPWSAAIRMRNQRDAEMRRYQEQLRDMVAKMSAADAAERREASQRLHEQVAQTLSAAKMFLSSIDSCSADDQMSLRSAEQIIGRAVRECRDVAQELSPLVLEAYGIAPALEGLVRRVAARSHASFSFDGADDIPLSADALIASFDVFSELIEIAASDPITSRVRIETARDADSMAASIEWDSTAAPDLFSACERMSRVGGEVLSSVTPCNTRVTVRAPLAI